MTLPPLHTIDLNYLNVPRAIAAYAIPLRRGVALVECGPASALPGLQAGLKEIGYTLQDVTDVLVTHIHLDHAGAAGQLARLGARVHVHLAGVPHLANPEKLLASAARLYGADMQRLWGNTLPVPDSNLHILQDREIVALDGVQILALDTPGHANHHMSYIYESVCFSGDFGGVRLGGLKHVRLPLVPPELHLGFWRENLTKLTQEDIHYIAPTHFGVFDDPQWHLEAARQYLDGVEAWLEAIMPSAPTEEQLYQAFLDWQDAFSTSSGLDESLLPAQAAANPPFLAVQGLLRYWKKYRA